MKKILTDFYGEDAALKFDPEKVDFKDKNTPKEIKILKNAQMILEVGIDKLL